MQPMMSDEVGKVVTVRTVAHDVVLMVHSVYASIMLKAKRKSVTVARLVHLQRVTASTEPLSDMCATRIFSRIAGEL